MRVLTLDVETSPLTAYVWGIREQHLSLANIVKEWHIMCWSAKWLGDPASKLIYRETRNGDDKEILKPLWDLLDEADVVISQNGEAFDEPKIQARMMEHGFKPYKPVKHHDTYKQLKNKAFTSHKLESLTDKFCKKYKKLKHKKFPGMSLWHECLKGNKDAWMEMRKYNEYDVLSTEELYLNTRGWSNTKAPVIISQTADRLCRYCGAFSLVVNKYKFSITSKKREPYMNCTSCGKYQKGKAEAKNG